MRELRFEPQLSCSAYEETHSEIFCCEHEQIQVPLNYETFMEEIDRRLEEGVTFKEAIEEKHCKMWEEYKECEEMTAREEAMGRLLDIDNR